MGKGKRSSRQRIKLKRWESEEGREGREKEGEGREGQ